MAGLSPDACVDELRADADDARDTAREHEDEAYRLDKLADELERPRIVVNGREIAPGQVRGAWLA